MDTFKYFYPDLGIFNSEIIIDNDDYHELDCISGELPTMISKIEVINKMTPFFNGIYNHYITPLPLFNSI